jgi:hypothetical protein
MIRASKLSERRGRENKTYETRTVGEDSNVPTIVDVSCGATLHGTALLGNALG